MLAPRKVKFRKMQKTRIQGVTSRGFSIDFGSYGLKAMTGERITARQIEAARRAITRHVKRGGKIWIRVFPDRPITKTSAETPMGGGKGAVDHYVAAVEPGRMMFEMDGVPEDVAREAFRLAAMKLPVKTKFLVKERT